MAYEIEPGIPMPDKIKHERAAKYNFAIMEVGDSFALPYGIKNPAAIASRARRNNKPKLFISGRDPKSNGVWRIWRTA